MKYLIITDSDVMQLSEPGQDLKKMFIEVDDKGFVKREVGFDSANHIIHAYPSNNKLYGKYRKYGIFDLAIFDMSAIRDELSKEEFEEIWKQVSPRSTSPFV